MDKDQLQQPSFILSSVIHEDAVVIKHSDDAVAIKRSNDEVIKRSDDAVVIKRTDDAVVIKRSDDAGVIKDSDKDVTEGRDTSTSVLPKDSSLLVTSKHLVGSESKQKPYPKLPRAYLLPYLVLINNCLHLPFSTIKKLCLTGEILCRVDSLMRRQKKEEPRASLEPEKEPTLQETKYVTFEGLQDLQWKLFKGVLKRKPKTVGIWREANYRKKPVTTVIREAKEYILPLIPKDWIIDASLNFSKEKIFSFLETESPLSICSSL